MVWALDPRTTRAEIPDLCARFATALRTSDATVVVCDAGAVTDPDLVTVETLAGLALTAIRHGRRVRLHRAGDKLCQLLTLTGLGDVVALDVALGIEPRRQVEQGEQALGVQERVQPDDLAG